MLEITNTVIYTGMYCSSPLDLKTKLTSASACSATTTKYLLLLLVNFILLSHPLSAIEPSSKELIPISSCRIPFKSCSADSRTVTQRRLCMNSFLGCSDGSYYLCGEDNTKTYIAEGCFPDLECQPGTTHGLIVVDAENMMLNCVPCPEGRFEPEFTRSSRSSILLGCTFKHRPADWLSSNLILHNKGTASSATEWYCDSENGYFEEDGNMLCDDIPTKSCHCDRKTCQGGTLLRPDGVCIECQTRLDPDDEFRCDHQSSTSSPLPTTSITTTLKQSTQNSVTSGHGQNTAIGTSFSVEDDGTQEKDSTKTDERRAPEAIVVIFGGLGCLVLFGIVVVKVCRKNHRHATKNSIHAQQNLQEKTNKNIGQRKDNNKQNNNFLNNLNNNHKVEMDLLKSGNGDQEEAGPVSSLQESDRMYDEEETQPKRAANRY